MTGAPLMQMPRQCITRDERYALERDGKLPFVRRFCRGCGGTGLVAPDAFGDVEAWHDYAARIACLHVANHWADSANPITAGMVHPAECPLCRVEVSRAS